MENETKAARRAHCVVLAYPAQGHINPMLEFSKRLQHGGINVTLVSTRFFCNKLQKLPSSNIAIETISDGFDNGGAAEAENEKVYYDRFRQVGTQTLIELIEKLNRTGSPVDCIIYDSFMTWVLKVARKLGLIGVSFLTQNLTVDSIYYYVNKGKLQLPLVKDEIISLPGLSSFEPWDMPTFLYEYEPGSAVLDLVVGQFSNIEEADWILCNSFYEMEIEVADWMRKIWLNLRTVGPTIPYKFLNNNNTLEDDEEDYGFAIFKSEECTKWLDNQPKQSVVFVSLGTMVSISQEQMEELAMGLIDSGITFLWVVRESEEAKLPVNLPRKSQKSLVVTWCHQLKVLSHEAIGCFVMHCGWNSTLEALSLGVPVVAMPLWSDQRTNAKNIKDVWKIGVRVQFDEKGIVRREALKKSIWEIMKGERGSEVKSNCIKWKNLAAMAVGRGGSSCKNIEEFMDSMSHLKVNEP
ncbi:UDP-glycosyltransferase 74G1-like [Neltuma alba]|uniref:UDP-glycosyltransferase 74G1-like n=1 Tax=Neltuma alba TaxID=207710 RepID=UPI0010A5A0AB|nr:UDP-glycosyltransferase 74G1-like [Prosopis alba]XP_028765423.1 UDP-glycosyltransferase 74G1-like [Prosopis alba]